MSGSDPTVGCLTNKAMNPPGIYRTATTLTVNTRWLGGSVVERQPLTGELSLVYTGPAADGYTIYIGKFRPL